MNVKFLGPLVVKWKNQRAGYSQTVLKTASNHSGQTQVKQEQTEADFPSALSSFIGPDFVYESY